MWSAIYLSIHLLFSSLAPLSLPVSVVGRAQLPQWKSIKSWANTECCSAETLTLQYWIGAVPLLPCWGAAERDGGKRQNRSGANLADLSLLPSGDLLDSRTLTQLVKQTTAVWTWRRNAWAETSVILGGFVLKNTDQHIGILTSALRKSLAIWELCLVTLLPGVGWKYQAGFRLKTIAS